MNFFVKRRLEPQRPIRQMFQRFQGFSSAFQQKLFVAPIEIRDDFFFARSSRAAIDSRSQHAHSDRKLKFARAHGLFQKFPQRIGGCVAIKLPIFHNFRRHG